MKRFFIGIFILLSSSSSILEAKHSTIIEAKPNIELTKSQAFIRGFFDFIGRERLGLKPVSQEIEQYIRLIQHEVGMDDYIIEIRSMSNLALRIVGRMNAFVVPSFWNAATRHNLMFISEEWFASLPEQEKRFLIKRELMHLKNNHRYKKLRLAVISLIGGYLIVKWYSRSCEKEADIQAASDLVSAQGGVDLMQRLINEDKKEKSKFVIKRFIDRTKYILGTPFRKVGELFMAHPTFKKRRAYLKKLATEYETQEQIVDKIYTWCGIPNPHKKSDF